MTKNLRKLKYINLVIKKINEPAKRKFHFTIPYSIQYSHIIMSRKLEKNNSSVLWIPLGNKLALIFEMVGILKIWRNLQKGLLETLGTSTKPQLHQFMEILFANVTNFRAISRNQRNCKCDPCGKSFKVSKNLVKHLLVRLSIHERKNIL